MFLCLLPPAPITFESTASPAVLGADAIVAVLDTGGDVTVETGAGPGNGDITVNSAIAKTAGGNATLRLNADRDIIVNESISSTMGALNVTLDAMGGVDVRANVTTLGGNFVATGASGLAGSGVGVLVGASIDAGGGNLYFHGTSASVAGSAQDGIQLNSSAILQTQGAGTIALTGVGGSGAADQSNGVVVGADAMVRSQSDISLVGTGNGSGGGNDGIEIFNIVEATGATSTVSLMGTSNSTGGSHNEGIGIFGATTVVRSGGEIALTGVGGNGTSNNFGIFISAGSTVEAASNITAIGTGNGSGTQNDGIAIAGNLDTTTGTIVLTGVGGNGGTSNVNGIFISSGGSVTADGEISLHGMAGSGSGDANDGILSFGTIESTGSNVTLVGTGGNYTDGNDGINLQNNGTVRAAGDITLQGTSGNGSNNNNGIFLLDPHTVRAGGNITFEGTGNGMGNLNRGLLVTGEIEATGTTSIVSLIGTSNGGGNSNRGINLDGMNSVVRSGGTIVLTGVAGDGVDDNSGIRIANNARVVAAGEVDAIGTGNGSGDGNHGITIAEDNSTIESMGAGAISLLGSGSHGNRSNAGVVVGTGVVVRTDGSLTAIGTGNGSAENNIGIRASGSLQGGTLELTGAGSNKGTRNANGISIDDTATLTASGDVLLRGMGGDGSLNINDGIVSFGTIESTAGSVTLMGTGGNTSMGTGTTGNEGITLRDGEVRAFDRILLQGTGGNGTDNNNGVATSPGNSVRAGGNITIEGTGNGTGNLNRGLLVTGEIEATGTTSVVSLIGTSNGKGNSNRGINLDGMNSVVRSGGTIVLTGVAGDGVDDNSGIRIANNARVVAAGEIDAIGTGNGSGDGNHGITIAEDNSTIESMGAGAISLLGSGSHGNRSNAGVVVGTGVVVRTDGSLTAIGTGNGSAENNIGIRASGSLQGGTLELTGAGSNMGTRNANGISIDDTATLTASGDVLLRGMGGDGSLNINDGIVSFGTIESTAGSVTLMGTGGDGTTGNEGITLRDGEVRAFDRILLQGTGGNGTDSNNGVATSPGNSVRAGGNITIEGTGNGTGVSNNGLQLEGTIESTGSGAIALAGTGGNGTDENHGIETFIGSDIRSQDGHITLAGTSNGTGANQNGINHRGTIESMGTGSIFLTASVPSGESAFQLDGTLATDGQTIALNVANGDFIKTDPLTASGSDITIENLGGDIVLGDVNTSTTLPGADAGSVTLTASNNVTATSIDTESDTGRGGNVRIVAGQSVRITGFFTASNGIDSSISTVGTPSGTIFIQHGGNGMTPFDVGNAATNGTASALTRGSAGESILAPDLPATSFLNNHSQDGGNIQIIAIAPPAPPPAIETEAETETELEMLLEIPPDVLVGAETSPLPTPTGLAPLPSPIGEPAALPESTVADGARVAELEPPFLAVTPPEAHAFALPEAPIAPTRDETKPNNLPASPPAPETSVAAPVLMFDQNPLANDLQGTGSIGVVEIVSTSEGLRIESRASSEVASPTATIAAENDRTSLEVGPAIARKNIRTLLDAGDVEAAVVKVDRLFTDLARIHVPPPYPNSFNATQQFRDALQEMWERTGKKSAIVYTVVQPDRLDLIFVTPDNETVYRQAAVPSDRLRSTISAFRDGMLVALRRRIGGHLQPSQELYDWLIAPLEADLEAAGVDTLLFSMDSGLRSLPIAALHDGEQYLVEKFALGLIPSLNLIDIGYRPLQNESVLAMGASQFEVLPPLPGVPLELAAIVGGEVSPNEREGVAGKTATPEEGIGDTFPPENRNFWAGSKLLDENFTLVNLVAERNRTSHAIVHFATHAEFQSDNAEDTYIQLWGERLQFDRLRQLDWHDPPVELLVLSACRTAVGDESSELGFAGLAVRSGIKSVLASLWYVSDAGTLALMDGFYDRLSQEDAATKAEALRQAQLALLHGKAYIRDGKLVLPNGEAPLPPDMQNLGEVDFSNPFYWSGFILVGSPW